VLLFFTPSIVATTLPFCITGGVVTGVQPSTGPLFGNNSVTIQGSAFSNGTDIVNVTFAGAQAVIQSQNATQVVVLAPASLTDVSVEIVLISASYGITRAPGSYAYLQGMDSDQTPDWCSISLFFVAAQRE
jgi:hypothetical protein